MPDQVPRLCLVRDVEDDHGRNTEGSEYGELDREEDDDGNEAERLRGLRFPAPVNTN